MRVSALCASQDAHPHLRVTAIQPCLVLASQQTLQSVSLGIASNLAVAAIPKIGAGLQMLL